MPLHRPRTAVVPRTPVVGLVVAGALGLVAPASASCAAPGLDPPAPLAPGAAVVVTGRGFYDACIDTYETPPGCSTPPAPRLAPARQVHLLLTQGVATWDLGAADADPRDLTATWRVVVPSEVQPGPASLSAGGAPGLAVTVAG